MRTKQKLTAVGAFALATTAVVGGAVVTSHAMSNGETPVKGTMTVVATTADSNGAIKCVYDDIDLPTAPIGLGTEAGTQVGDGSTAGHTALINVIGGKGPVDKDGNPVAGAVIVSSSSAALPDGATPGDGPTLTVHGSIGAATTSSGAVSVSSDDATLPPLPAGAVVLNADDARPGTAQECAALRPTTAPGAPPSIP
jgi:hypothetical protein